MTALNLTQERADFEAACELGECRNKQGDWQGWIAAKRAALAQSPVCHHRIADARNPVVTSGYICIDCGAVFAAADHDRSKAAPVSAEGLERDAARFQQAIALDDNAEALYTAVLNNSPDGIAIRCEFDAAMAADKGAAS